MYGRVLMLTGQIHLIQGFGYWLVIHCIAELGMVWCAEILAASFSAGIWLIYHIDVLPDKGGMYPVEAAGPFLAALTLELQYGHWGSIPDQGAMSLSRVFAACCIILQIIWTCRLLMLAAPSNLFPTTAREAGGDKNLSAPCDHPNWLPTAYQHVAYLVGPPRQAGGKFKPEDPMLNVDMMPWKATRGLYICVIVGWFVLLIGRIVEAATGERMLVTNPGFPPWTRTGQWDGWEHGPITSKHYAHVTPMRGHFAWKYGQGPQGYQELWPSDLFGFAPEADAWWADEVGQPEGFEKFNAPPGAAVHDPYASPMLVDPTPPKPDHHRRLRKVVLEDDISRTLVPAAVQWPAALEPDLVACAPKSFGGQVAAIMGLGHGAFVPGDAAIGKVPGVAQPFTLEGLPALGMAHGVSWGHEGITILTGQGSIHKCIKSETRFNCHSMKSPPLPLRKAGEGGFLPAVALDLGEGKPLLAAVTTSASEVHLLQLGMDWQFIEKAHIPYDQADGGAVPPSVVAVSAAEDHLMVTASDGATYRWGLQAGRLSTAPVREAPAYSTAAVGSTRTWRSACSLASGKTIRLASRWQKAVGEGSALTWHPELLF